jgi:hypothetical protein
MNSKPAFLNDGLDFGESVFRRVIRLERTPRDKPGAQGVNTIAQKKGL